MLRRLALGLLLALAPAFVSAQQALIAPTAPAGNNSNRIATTGFVIGQSTTETYSGTTTVPWSEYVLSGSTVNNAVKLIRATLPGPHTTSDLSALAIEARPQGSGLNGPTPADFALSLSIIKQGWPSPTIFGEADGLNIVLRTGGPVPSGGNQSDGAGILINAENLDGRGYIAGVEGVVGSINPATTASVKHVRFQLGAVDGVAGTAYGLVLIADDGVSNGGLLIQNNSGTFTDFISARAGATLFFNVAGNGDVSGNSITTATVTVASLPAASAGNKGMRMMVSNATATTFWTIVAGGGANIVPVTSDGANWRIG